MLLQSTAYHHQMSLSPGPSKYILVEHERIEIIVIDDRWWEVRPGGEMTEDLER